MASEPVPLRGAVIRRAGRGDAAALVHLVNAAYRGDSSRRGWTTEAHLLGGQRLDEQMITETLARTDTAVLLGEAEGRVQVCCEVRFSGEDAHFGMFAVHPDAQGRGLGRRMLDRAEETAAGQGCTSMRMEVLRQREDLIAWYERRGYRRSGAVSSFPYGDPRFGLPRRGDLEFAELAKELAAAPEGAGAADEDAAR